MPSSQLTLGVNDLQSQFPEVAKEWHPTRNGDLTPTEVARSSNKKVWWQCSKHSEHEWDTTINNRTKGKGCPICSGQKVLAGFNDLKTTDPEVAKEWHLTRNGDLKPTEVARSAHKKVWWQCRKFPNHIWDAQISNRSNGSGCPICSGLKVLEGFNDLNTTHPEIAKEWHLTRNGDLKPTEVARASNKKVWWQCSNYSDHEWDAEIYNRSVGGGCPTCAGKRVLAGFNDLKTTDPEVAKEWHPTRNGDLKPNEVARSSNQKVWWQCSKYPDHEWDTSVDKRSSGQGCPICAGKRVLEGFNDLKSTKQEIAREWHPTKNGDLTPTEVARSSSKKVWWQCSKYPEHEWDASVDNRSRGKGCPICCGLKVLEGFNDLNTTAPEVAKEWHPTRNGDLIPNEVTRGSENKVWWQCSKYPDHEWDASINHRSRGQGCPICSGRKVLEGFNDFKLTDPDVAKEWHPTRNGDLNPTEVTRSSNKKVWWQCSKCSEHQWDAVISSRSVGNGCPFCAEFGFNPDKDAWFYLMQRPGEQQIGITNVLSDRLRRHQTNGWTLLEHTTEPAPGRKVFDTEKAFKKWLKREIGLMEGTTENWSTTSMEVQSLAELKARSGIKTDLF
jgi:hypothetical protein